MCESNQTQAEPELSLNTQSCDRQFSIPTAADSTLGEAVRSEKIPSNTDAERRCPLSAEMRGMLSAPNAEMGVRDPSKSHAVRETMRWRQREMHTEARREMSWQRAQLHGE